MKVKICDLCKNEMSDPGCDASLHSARIVLYADVKYTLDAHIGCLRKHSRGKLNQLINDHSFVYCPS